MLLCLGAAGALPPGPLRDPFGPKAPGLALFTNGPIPSLSIRISPAGMDALRGNPRANITAEVTEGGRTYRDVAVHLKGASGSFRRVDDKPALILHFARYTPDQRFYGLRKILLNNSVQDPGLMNEKIGNHLFRAAGVPAPRTGHALVELNGRQLGLYVIKEDYNEDMLEFWFAKTGGNLYDINPGRDIHQTLRLDFGAGPTDRSDLRALADACEEKDPETRWQKLEKHLDIDRFISFAAMESITSHWDGYTKKPNNFKVYFEAETGRAVFLPNDLDQLFRRDWNIYTPGTAGLAARAVLNHPRGRELYRARVGFLATNVFNLAELTNLVHQTAAALRPAVEAWNKEAVQKFSQLENIVIGNLTQRSELLQRQVREEAQRSTAMSRP